MKRAFALLVSLALLVVLGAVASCSRSAEPVPLRTFERAQKLDTICLEVFDAAGVALRPPRPAASQNECTTVPVGMNGTYARFHLFALVTQTIRGEVAVVDLTASGIVDVDHSTPGVNFVPVGALPTDIAAAPDSRITFVASAEPNKWAIYALPSAPPTGRGVLGDSYAQPIPKLTYWPSCALPQAPSGLLILPRGEDPTLGYDLAVVFPGSGRAATKIGIIDPAPFLVGAQLDPPGGPSIEPGSLAPCIVKSAIELTGDVPDSAPLGPEWKDGVAYVDGGLTLPLPPAVTCEDTAADAGTPAADGGADAGAPATVAIPRLPGDVPRAVNNARDGQFLYLADEGMPLIHVLDFTKPDAPRELPPLLATSFDNAARRVSVGPLAVSPATRDSKRFLYAVDRIDGSLMVFDVTDVATGANPRVPMRRPHAELNPFQPADRIAFSSPVSGVSFVRNDWPLFRSQDQSLPAPKTGLLCNPNPNANADLGKQIEQPFKDPGAYYRANTPLGSGLEVALGPQRLRGVFAFVTLGSGQLAIVDVDDWDAPCRRPDPMGILTTVENGRTVETLATGGDFDPNTSTPQPLRPPVFSEPTLDNSPRSLGVSDLAPLMPQPTSGDDLDPYHAPIAFYNSSASVLTTGASNEAFFPISAPHRIRSFYMLRRDPLTGVHIPYLPSLAQLRSKGAPVNTFGPNAVRNPVMLPTYSPLPDPEHVKTPTEPNPRSRDLTKEPRDPSVDVQIALDTAHLPLQSSSADVRFSWEVPEVHIDQDWTITYEGALPGFDRTAATIVPHGAGSGLDAYSALELQVPNGLLCGKGIVDHDIAMERAVILNETFGRAVVDGEVLIPAPEHIDRRLGDYVEIVDDILPADHPYWSTAEPTPGAGAPPAEQKCWDDRFQTATSRRDICQSVFGNAGDESPNRDFPILEAHDDHLVIGGYEYPGGNTTDVQSREVGGKSLGLAPTLQLARCCFHRQARFRVRSGAEWIAVGTATGFLHSITTNDAGRCVPSCRSEDGLLIGRAAAVPRALDITLPPDLPDNATADERAAHDTEVARVTKRREALKAFVQRNSALAMRNPMFSIVMWNAFNIDAATGKLSDATPLRDVQWSFSTRGQFTPYLISLGTRTVAISPQSLRFIEPLRQIAVVDASNQGLQLFDLRTLAAVREPYL
jgi:hypothetical protein